MSLHEPKRLTGISSSSLATLAQERRLPHNSTTFATGWEPIWCSQPPVSHAPSNFIFPCASSTPLPHGRLEKNKSICRSLNSYRFQRRQFERLRNFSI